MHRQIVYISHLDEVAGQYANGWRNRLSIIRERVVSSLRVIQCSQGEWIPHLWSIGNELLLGEKRECEREEDDERTFHADITPKAGLMGICLELTSHIARPCC